MNHDMNPSDRSGSRRPLLIILCLMAVILVTASVSTHIMNRNRAEAEEEALESSRAEQYHAALERIDRGEYEEAYSILEAIDPRSYLSTVDLMMLCRAYSRYAEGSIYGAYYSMPLLEDLEGVAPDQLARMKMFRKTVREAYSEKERQDAATTTTRAVPYVGMSESQIGNTALGRPSEKVRHNTAMIRGKRYTANLYDFVENGRVVFTARCIDGKVTEVWDTRGTPAGTTKARSSSAASSGDPYHAKDYVHPDDFYYDHYDDFVDFEDAEDYYDSHHKG